MGLEELFTRYNRLVSSKYANLMAEYTSVSAIQRIAVEVVFSCGVVAAAIWFAWVDGDLKSPYPFSRRQGWFRFVLSRCCRAWLVLIAESVTLFHLSKACWKCAKN